MPTLCIIVLLVSLSQTSNLNVQLDYPTFDWHIFDYISVCLSKPCVTCFSGSNVFDALVLCSRIFPLWPNSSKILRYVYAHCLIHLPNSTSCSFTLRSVVVIRGVWSLTVRGSIITAFPITFLKHFYSSLSEELLLFWFLKTMVGVATYDERAEQVMIIMMDITVERFPGNRAKWY